MNKAKKFFATSLAVGFLAFTTSALAETWFVETGTGTNTSYSEWYVTAGEFPGPYSFSDYTHNYDNTSSFTGKGQIYYSNATDKTNAEVDATAVFSNGLVCHYHGKRINYTIFYGTEECNGDIKIWHAKISPDYQTKLKT